MTTTRAGPRGILLVCQCGNRFLVPKRQAGERVTCTLCGAALAVPASRSVHQAAADALDSDDQRAVWKALVEQESKAATLEKKERIKRPGERTSWWSAPRRRTWLAVAVIAAVCLAIAAGGVAVVSRSWKDSDGWPQAVYVSEQGGFAVRLPSGLTGRHSSRTLGPHPKWKYTFDGVRFGDRTQVGVAYMDIHSDEELIGLPDPVLAFLQRECHGEVSVVDQCEIRLGHHPGRQVTYGDPARPNKESYSRWFLVRNRLYHVTWISGFRQPSIAAVVEFLDSFRLLDEPEAEVTLVNGP